MIIPRFMHKIYAYIMGYFWLPCPICGNKFGGHEWIRGHSIYKGNGIGEGICYRKECFEKAKEISNENAKREGWIKFDGRSL